MHAADRRTAGRVVTKQIHGRVRSSSDRACVISRSQTFASKTISSTLTSWLPIAPESGVVLVSVRMMGRLLSSKGV